MTVRDAERNAAGISTVDGVSVNTAGATPPVPAADSIASLTLEGIPPELSQDAGVAKPVDNNAATKVATTEGALGQSSDKSSSLSKIRMIPLHICETVT